MRANTRTVNRNELVREFFPEQREFIGSAADEVLFSGAFGAGKSRSLCEKGLMLSLRYPGNRGGLFRKELIALKATTLITLLEGDGRIGPVLPPEYIKNHHKTERTITLKNNSVIIYGGLDNPNWIKSLNLGWAGIDQIEELTEEDYNVVMGRLRHPVPRVRQVFGACNPESPTHWLYQRFFRSRPAGTKAVSANTFSNPYLPEDYKARLGRYKGRFYDRYVLGKWVAFEGLIYDNFDPSVHIVDPFEIPEGWPRFRVVDFGYRNPFVCQWWAVSPDDIYYMYREIYFTHRLVSEHAGEIMGWSAGESVERTFADHDAEDRATLHAGGVRTRPAVKDVSPGIQAVYERLAVGEDGKAGIYFFRNALVEVDSLLEAEERPLCTLDELQGYAWKKAGAGRAPKEEPVKENDHGMDAMRYFVMSMKKRGMPRIRGI
jgi:PBSX family phage terminase large subunit